MNQHDLIHLHAVGEPFDVPLPADALARLTGGDENARLELTAADDTWKTHSSPILVYRAGLAQTYSFASTGAWGASEQLGLGPRGPTGHTGPSGYTGANGPGGSPGTSGGSDPSEEEDVSDDGADGGPLAALGGWRLRGFFVPGLAGHSTLSYTYYAYFISPSPPTYLFHYI